MSVQLSNSSAVHVPTVQAASCKKTLLATREMVTASKEDEKKNKNKQQKKERTRGGVQEGMEVQAKDEQ